MEINLLLLAIALVYLLFYIGCWIYVVNSGESDLMLGVIAWSTVIGGTLILLGGIVAGFSNKGVNTFNVALGSQSTYNPKSVEMEEMEEMKEM